MAEAALALDIGGSKIAAGVVALASSGEGGGRVSHRAEVPTPARAGGAAVLDAVTGLARTVLTAARAERLDIAALGVASAGTVSPHDGSITHATDLIPGWAGTPLQAHLARELGLPVTVLNDVHAHGAGEALAGPGAGVACLLVVAVGTGVGGALVVDGRPVTGSRGVAGHVGHVPVPEAAGLPCSCGRTGHLEALASGSGLEAAHRARTGGDLSGREIAALAASGDPGHEGARALLHEAGRATGRAVGALLNVLDPEAVVIGGGLASAGAPWQQGLHEGVRLEALDAVADTPVRLSTAGADAALRGAAHVALTATHPRPAEETP